METGHINSMFCYCKELDIEIIWQGDFYNLYVESW